MSAAIIPFRAAAWRQVDEALAEIQAETLRQTRQLINDSWHLRAESRRIQRRYIERQARIEKLLEGIGAEVARV